MTTTQGKEGETKKVKVFSATECELQEVRFLKEVDEKLFELHIPEGVQVVDECDD